METDRTLTEHTHKKCGNPLARSIRGNHILICRKCKEDVPIEEVGKKNGSKK